MIYLKSFSFPDESQEGSVLDDDTDFGPEGSGPSRVADLFLRNTESFFIFGGVTTLLSAGAFYRTPCDSVLSPFRFFIFLPKRN